MKEAFQRARTCPSAHTATEPQGMIMPETLQAQLRLFENRLRLVETATALFGALCGLAASYVILFVSDRFWSTPGPMRLVLFVAGAFLSGWFAMFWLRNWWWQKRDSRALARLIQKKYRGLGDRLLGAVELSEGFAAGQAMSPALCRAAIRQVAREAADCDFGKAASTRRPRRYGMTFIALTAAAVTPFLLAPEAGLNALARWSRPLAPVDRFTFVRIQDIPDPMIVPHDERFEISCRIDESSRWIPATAVCRFENQPPIAATIAGRQAVFDVPAQIEPGCVTIRIGDVRRSVRVQPVFRPGLTDLTADVVLPDYLKLPKRAGVPILNTSPEFLDGSRISFKGAATRQLESAELVALPPAPLDTQRSETPPQPSYHKLNVSGIFFASAEMPLDCLGACEFDWTDKHGLKCKRPYTVAIRHACDMPPTVELKDTPPVSAILEDEIVEFAIHGTDDFGIERVWVKWTATNENDETPDTRTVSRDIIRGGPHAAELSGKYTFSPIAEGITEGMLVTLNACISDFRPGRRPSVSQTCRIYVRSRSEHAKIILQRMESIRNALEEVIREEEHLIAENTALAAQPAEKMATEQTGADLGRARAREDGNATRLNDLAKLGHSLVKEASKNRDIDENMLRRWTSQMGTMNEIAGAEMKNASSRLARAGSDVKPGDRCSNIRKAISHELEALEKLRKLENRINRSAEDMIARNFVNRLLLAAQTEDDIASSLQDMLPHIIGLPRNEIGPDRLARIDQTADLQDDARKEVKNVQDDLFGFYARTRIERYNEIAGQMREAETSARLAAIAGYVRENLAIKATEQALDWKKRLEGWADALRVAAKSRCSSDSPSGDNMSETDIEVLIALMRSRQAEENIREHTRLLEERRSSDRNYRQHAANLARKQYELARDIRPLERKAENDRVRRFVEKIGGEMMNAGMLLRKPLTDRTTIAVETEIIELLSDSVNACKSGAQSQCQSQSLMQALGMKPSAGSGQGSGGGGSTMGGDTEDPNTTVTGNANGADPDERNIDRTGGNPTEDLPLEFRDALESYFRAMEESR